MHGLPLAWAKFERRNVPSVGWRIAVSGQNELVRGTYQENANRSQITLAEPGYYLVVVQTDTARAQTEIELETPTALAINTLGRWNVGGIVQPINVVPAANGLADPVVNTLTRQWMPFDRVAMAWPIQTTAADQPVRWRWASGQTAGQHTPTIYVWRFFNYAGGIQKTQESNRAFLEAVSVGDFVVVRLDPPTNPWYSPTLADWYRITTPTANLTNLLRWTVETLHDYTHKLRLITRATPLSGASGDILFRVFDATGANIHEQAALYGATETVYEVNFARRAAGQQIDRVEIFKVDTDDALDVRVELNVTD